MKHPSIEGEGIPYYAEQYTWNIVHAYIDAHSQRLIYAYPGYGIEAVTRLQPQCANTTFAEKSRYNRYFQKVVHKGGESAINYIKIFQNEKALAVSAGNSYSKYQLMDNFLWKFPASRKVFSSDSQPSSRIEKRTLNISKIDIFICLANWLLE